jgi:hypothetical protein
MFDKIIGNGFCCGGRNLKQCFSFLETSVAEMETVVSVVIPGGPLWLLPREVVLLQLFQQPVAGQF